MLQKKKWITLVACLLAGMMLMSCSSHKHTVSGEWLGDLKNHWKVCEECGEKAETAAHKLEGEVCTVCGSEVLVWEEGGGMITACNEQGDCISAVSYDADGDVLSEEKYEFAYDADGNKIHEKDYLNGMLICEYEYAQNQQNQTYVTRNVYYYDDGSKNVNEYDDAEKLLRTVNYAADGSIEYSYDYEYSADGSWMSETEYYGDLLIAEREYTVDEDGLQTLLKDITYQEDGSWMGVEYDLYDNPVIEIHSDANGNVELDRRYVYTYNEFGDKTLSQMYDNDRLVEEVEYITGSDEYGHWSTSGKTTVYHEDGSKTVSDQDPDLTWATEITYDAAGNIIHELRYEYEYDEEGVQSSGRSYENGRLIEETLPIKGDDGETIGVIFTTYNEDGTKTVREYDEFFELVKETTYDKDGNIVSES